MTEPQWPGLWRITSPPDARYSLAHWRAHCPTKPGFVHVNWDLRLRACPQAKHEATATHAGVENFLKKALVSPVLDLRPTSRPSAT
jgi:hypothetical protein